MGCQIVTNYDRLTLYRRFVDSILLATARLVAVSDPLLEQDVKLYATTFTSTRGAHTQDAGIGIEGDEDDARELASQIAVNRYAAFMCNYIKALRRLFKFSEGNEDRAILHFGASMRSIQGEFNCHLKFKTIAPWLLIEPTGVVFELRECALAGAEGYGALCTPLFPGTLPTFSRMIKSDQSAYGTAAYMDWRCARKYGAVLHTLLHPKDGLVNMRVTQASTVAWGLTYEAIKYHNSNGSFDWAKI